MGGNTNISKEDYCVLVFSYLLPDLHLEDSHCLHGISYFIFISWRELPSYKVKQYMHQRLRDWLPHLVDQRSETQGGPQTHPAWKS